MRLSVNVIIGKPTRYYKAGEDVPVDKLPAVFHRYAVTENLDAHQEPPRALANTAHRHARKPAKDSKR